MIQILYLHGGIFHADDVFCAAFAKILNPNCEIHRVSRLPIPWDDTSEEIIAADIGGGRFDHHQTDTPLRHDEIRHCAASLLWQAYGKAITTVLQPDLDEEQQAEVSAGVDRDLLRTVSVIDNSSSEIPAGTYTVCSCIGAFNPEWNDTRTPDDAFAEAVQYADGILRRCVRHLAAKCAAKMLVCSALKTMHNGAFVLPKFAPWQSYAIEDPQAKAAIFSSLRGGWNLQLVPMENGSFETRAHVPENWRGKQGAEAAQAQPGMTFCHASGFLSAFDTLQHALDASAYLK